MKNTVWFVVAALSAFSCSSADSAGELVTPVPVELSSEQVEVRPTLLCSGDTCPDFRMAEPGRTQQGLSSLSYSTYLGGGANDGAIAVAVDPMQNAYITGCTNSFGGGANNIFVAKMSPTGQNLYFTYFPGYCSQAIAVDSAGNAYIAGSADGTYGGGSIVAKLNPSGSAFAYYKLLPWQINGITVDTQGYAYIAGFFRDSTNNADAYVGKLNPAGSAFVYSVAFGGSGGDGAHGIAVDRSGIAYIVGDTDSTDFPVWNAYQSTLQGTSAAFVAKLNASGTGLIYSTYLGHQAHGPTAGLGVGVAVDSVGSAYVTGITGANFPVTAGAAQPSFGGGSADAYAAKLNASGWLVYATYLGGSGGEWSGGIAVDSSSGTAYVKGNTQSLNFPVTSNAYQAFSRGDADIFVTQLNPSGSAFLQSSYLGGSGEDISNFVHGTGVALDAYKNVYVVGATYSINFPTNVYAYGGDGDAFITKFNGQ